MTLFPSGRFWLIVILLFTASPTTSWRARAGEKPTADKVVAKKQSSAKEPVKTPTAIGRHIPNFVLTDTTGK